ncbi:MAG: hypothetical protein FJZ59_07630 [Chlamydiae bacterium]|nr:hypothetical protein [Chlamydiota bacterium]
MMTLAGDTPFLFQDPESAKKSSSRSKHRRGKPDGALTKKINLIVSLLHKNDVFSKKSLLAKLPEIRVWLKKEGVFGDCERENIKLLQKAVKAYSKIEATSISFEESDYSSVGTLLARNKLSFIKTPTEEIGEISSETASDGSSPSPYEKTSPSFARHKFRPHSPIESRSFHRIVTSYDRLSIAKKELKEKSATLMGLIEKEGAPEIEHLIIGRGDTALALWTEEHQKKHSTPHSFECLPEVLLIGKDSGSWKRDYTLAQRHAMLERLKTPCQPSDFVTDETYVRNRHVNARHLYQANQCSLAETNAPVLDTEIKEVENFKPGMYDEKTPWEKPDSPYRALVQTSIGPKYIYTKKIDICAGLGEATNPLLNPVKVGGEILKAPLSKEDFTRLSRFDPEKRCTPLIDGNEYVLSDIEGMSSKGRSVIVYGGGGTAAACGRKAFHGDDLNGEEKSFAREDAKNSVLWVARNDFEKSGTGTLASKALRELEKRKGLTLVEIIESDGRLNVTFAETTGDSLTLHKFVCDQLIYSTGQTDDHLHPFLKNITDKPEPLFVEVEDGSDEVLVGAKAGDDIRLLGAAADAAITTRFDTGTWKFLHSTHVGGDVGPGSMPPTTAQLRLLKATESTRLHIVNLNIDHPSVIKRFLYEAGAPPRVIQNFLEDLLLEREKSKPKGFDREITKQLIRKHTLDAYVSLDGHSSLVT